MAEKPKIKPASAVVNRRTGAVVNTSAFTGNRQRNGSVEVRKNFTVRKAAKVGKREYASAGRYSFEDSPGRIGDDTTLRQRLQSIRSAGRNGINPNSGWGMYEQVKTAGLFSDSGIGPADILDSQNIGYYSYEFPVDALELPSSRPEELRFYRLAYDRDPIVGRAIDMHTELPLSKMSLEKPKGSSEEFVDYVQDYFQALINDTHFFQVLIQATREYNMIGEAFIFIEEDEEEVKLCKEAQKIVDKKQKGKETQEGKESQNAPLNDSITDWLQPEKRSSLLKKKSALIEQLKKADINFHAEDKIADVITEIKKKTASLKRKQASLAIKTAKLIAREGAPDTYPIQVTAAPPADPAGMDEAPAGIDPEAVPDDQAPLDPDAPGGDAGEITGEPGTPMGAEGMEGMDMPGGAPMGGGGGGMPITPDQAPAVDAAIQQGISLQDQRQLMQMKHYLFLLEKKKELLEELQEVREKKKEELEFFNHVVNPDYHGFSRCQVLPPEQIEIENDGGITDGPTIWYKPPEKQKQVYLKSPDVSAEVKDMISREGKVALETDPFQGSYVIHFARKKSGYELHGRSILQRCIRTVIYREKLRQVQSTIASRNMTPKTMIVAPDIPLSEVMSLRAHVDEAKADPDYTIVVNYEAQWNEIGSEARLLSLDGEWQHTNSDLAIGLGLSPEILIGEGLYSGNRIQLEIMNTTYLQFRDLLGGIVEDEIFKPIAMKKGFYELDKYGNPRWLYPKVTFSRMALRDSGDLYDMLFNLYSKGSLPVDTILEFLNVDPEDCKRKLEDNLFTVNDSKFNELLSNIYNSMAEWLLKKTDLAKRVTEGLTLDEVDNGPEEGPEGTGEGV